MLNAGTPAAVVRQAVSMLCWAILSSTAATAADDPSIKGELRTGIQSAMEEYIDHQTIEGIYRLYDPVDGRLLHLTEAHLHAGIVKKGDYYVSCADFTDQDGQKIDIDFLVLNADGTPRAVQGIVHKVEGTKRPYHLEKE